MPFPSPVPAPAHGGDLATEIRYLVASAQPAVVFSSLARLCVPTFSDGCTADIVEDGCTPYRIAYPSPHKWPSQRGSFADKTIRTRVEGAAMLGAPRFTGVITHTWATHHPTAADANRAASLARHAVTTIYLQRLTVGNTYHDAEPAGHPRSSRRHAT